MTFAYFIFSHFTLELCLEINITVKFVYHTVLYLAAIGASKPVYSKAMPWRYDKKNELGSSEPCEEYKTELKVTKHC